MISKNTITVHPAQLAYPITKRSLTPDYKDVFPSGFGPKEPFAFPEGGTAINAAANLAMSSQEEGDGGGGETTMPLANAFATKQTAAPPSGPAPAPQGIKGKFEDFLNNLFGGINISGKGANIGGVIFIGIFVIIIIAIAMRGKGIGGGGKKKGRRRRSSRRR